MKIGHISLTYRPVFGGQDTYIENLKRIFSDLGHQNTVYQALSLRHKINMEGVRIIRTPPIFGRWIANFNWYYFNFFLKRVFKKDLLKEDALIVHYATHYPAVKYHKKVVILSHGIEWHTPPDQWDDGLRARLALETFKKCTVVANDTEYLRFCGVKIEPATNYFKEIATGKWFIPNCVDTDFFKPGDPNSELLALNAILVPRNIYFLRGVHLAIEAFSLFVNATGNLTFNLVVIGKIVDENYYRECVELIKNAKLQSRVHFKGHRRWEEMRPLYAASRCTMIPTIDCEGTSLSALESMACGTPVIATSVAGLKDIPCLHADKTPEALAKGLESLLAKRDEESLRQRKAVIDTFNMKNWAEAWKRVIDAV